MALFDNFFNQQGGGLLGDLPPWMAAMQQKPGDSVLPPWLQTPLSGPVPGQFPPMQQDALPPNAPPAAGQLPPQLQQMMAQPEQRRSMWTPADAPDDSPPVNPNAPQYAMRPPLAPQMGGPAMGAPMPPQQAPGMSAMAQAPQGMPQGQPQMQPQGGGSEIGTNIKDFLLGTLTGGPLGGFRAMANHSQKQELYDKLAPIVGPQKAWFAVNSPDTGKLAGVLGPETSGIVINNRLVDPKTGKQIADYSDTSTKAPETKEFETPGGGKVPMQYNPSAKKWEPISEVPNSQQLQNEINQRKSALMAQGLNPADPQHRAYVLTGKMPREDQQPLTATDKKAILEADEGVSAAESAVKALQQAKVISKNAYGGPLAGLRGYATGLVGSEAGQATTDLDNLLTTNALGQMKAIFGGNPTEGERKILLEIQGASSQPDEVRQKIFDRAIVMANRRLDFNKSRSDELRGGTFYKPPNSQGNTASGGSGAPASPDPLGIR